MQFIRKVLAGIAIASAWACASSTIAEKPRETDREIDPGTTVAELIELRGEPDRINDRVERDRTFRTFYYADGIFYVVDLGEDIVCEQGIGESNGYCYPCDYGPSAGTCP